MKYWLTILLMTIIILTGKGQDYSLNDTLYIWEMHGLEMIADPENPKQIQEKFYYGLPARVVDTDIHRFPASMEVNEGFSLPGHWVRVIINQDTGYVFDGYLSHLKPFDLRSDARGIDLVRQNFQGTALVSEGIRSSAAGKLEEGESRSMRFENDIKWTIRDVKPCIVEKYIVPGVRFSVVYQLMMAVYSNYFDQNATYMAEPEFLRMNGNRYDFILRGDTNSRQISILRKNGQWVINAFSCSN